MQKYIRAESLAQAVLICLGLQMAVGLGSMVSSLLQVRLLMRAMAGEEISDTEASLNDLREGGIGMVAILIAIVSGFLFLKYLGRANHNAAAMGASGLSATPGWTIGYFFVPIVNLWRPYQIVQEIWKASAPEPGEWTGRPGNSLIGWWWGLRLIDLIASRIVLQMNLKVPEGVPNLEYLISTTWVTFGTEALDLVVLLLSFIMIRDLQRRQVERYETIGEPASAQCPSCGEPLGSELAFETTCPVCGTVVKPEWAKA